MTITDDIRVQVIKEYEEQKLIEAMKSRNTLLGANGRYIIVNVLIKSERSSNRSLFSRFKQTF